ncbi:MAG TPA: HAMP domain-containing sensor histidine kinase [Nitrospirota bacterium]
MVFFAGLSGLLLSQAALSAKKSPGRLNLSTLAWFGAAYAASCIFELLLMTVGSDSTLTALRVVALAVACLALVIFGKDTLSGKDRAWWVMLPVVLLPLLGFAGLNEAAFEKVSGLPAEAVTGLVLLAATVCVTIYGKPAAGGAEDSRKPSWTPLAAVLAIFIAGWGLTNLAGNYGEQMSRKSLLMRTMTAVSAIEPGLVASLSGTPADKDTPQFQAVRARLIAIRRGNPDSRFAYIMGMQGGKMYFMADAEPEDSKDYSAPGDPYGDATQQNIDDYINARTTVSGPDKDAWGVWVSGLAPIVDGSTGKMVGQFGMDVNALDWNRNIGVYRLFCILTTWSLCIIAIALFFAWQRTREAAAQSAALVERRKLEQQRSDFNSMVTQDLKAPLSAIFGYTDILLTDMADKLDGEAKDVIGSVQESCMKLVGMVDDFIALSRLEYSVMPLVKTRVEIAPVVKDIAENLSGIRKGEGARLEYQAEGEVQPVFADRLLVQRAIANLLQNALNRSGSGGRVLLKARNAVRGGSGVEVFTVDDGPAISADEKKRLFEKFYRPSGVGGRGSGLNLAIVRAVAEAHGGKVFIESAEGQGTTILGIFLPAGEKGPEA